MDLDDIRRDYHAAELNRDDLHDNPFEQFSLWMEDTIRSGVRDPTAMVLATVSADGQPSQRIVLLKQVSDAGFVFFTNYESQKAEDISGQAKVSLLFPWHAQNRQVKVCGRATKVPAADAREYFDSRPLESRIAAWASPQSRVVGSREDLLKKFEEYKAKFLSGEVPLPDFWGGYCVQPESFEFWQGRSSRLHDRFSYEKLEQSGGWRIQRLAP